MPLSAQQAADPNAPALVAVAQPKKSKGKKLEQLWLVQPVVVQKGIFRYITQTDREPKDAETKAFKVFAIMTPQDYVAAARTYAEGNLAEAKRQLAAVRTKYVNFAGLQENPAVKAALLELHCMARLMDWNGLAKAADSFPFPDLQGSDDRALIAAARVLSHVSDDPATAAKRQKEVEEFLADSKKMKYIRTGTYGWLKYALARALASGLPADAPIPEDKLKQAVAAVDAYCEAAVCYRGRDMEIAQDAMTRAIRILWAMPAVKSYAAANKKMDAKKWSDAPSDFRDAVSMAYMMENIFAPGVKDEVVHRAAAYYVNPQEGKPDPQQEEAKPEAEKKA